MGIRILLRVIHLNHEYGEGWTKWDFLDIAEWVLKYNVENPESFKDSVNTITLWLDDKWDLINRLSTYEEKVESLESYLTGEFENQYSNLLAFIVSTSYQFVTILRDIIIWSSIKPTGTTLTTSY